MRLLVSDIFISVTSAPGAWGESQQANDHPIHS
jgi:hypothetical protein